MNQSGTDDVECCKKVASGWKVVGAITSLVNARDLQPECARALHEGLLVPFLLYGSETMIWREKKGSGFRIMQMENPKVLQGTRRRIECQMHGLESYAE